MCLSLELISRIKSRCEQCSFLIRIEVCFFFSVLYIENIFLYLKILQMNWFGNSGRRVKTKGNNNENMMPASQNTYVGCMWVPGSHADLIPDGR